jgi:hypothetical protein
MICIIMFYYFEGVYYVHYDTRPLQTRTSSGMCRIWLILYASSPSSSLSSSSSVADILLFLKTVHHEERADILFDLEDDDGAHGLTKDWSEVEWVCRQHEASRSTTKRPENGGEEKAASGYALPPERSSTQAGSEELDLEALIREACELVRTQIKAEEGSVAESGPSESGRDAEDRGSRHTKDEAYGEAGRDRYHGTTEEGAEEATLSACEEWTTMDEAGDYEFRTPRVRDKRTA